MTQQKNEVVERKAPELPANPFAKELSRHVNAGTVEIEASRAIAEAQGKLLIAKRFPRDQAQAFTMMMQSCSRTAFASSAMYSYPRGGQTVSGPSIRMAEELARNWGNIEFGTRELSRRDGESEMEAYAWDLETNLVRSIKFTVKHIRDKQSGKTLLTDERDIYEVTANMGGRRVRACLLAVLPPDYVEAAIDHCRKTLKGKNEEPLIDRVKKMLVVFSKWNVTKEMIERRLNKKVENIFEDDLVDLTSIHNSIRDQQSEVADWFSVEAIAGAQPEGEAPSVDNLSKNRKKGPAKTEPKEPLPQGAPPVTTTAEAGGAPEPQNQDDDIPV